MGFLLSKPSLANLPYSLYPTLELRKLRQRPLRIGKFDTFVYSFDYRTKMIVAIVKYGRCHAVCARFRYTNFSNWYRYDSSFVMTTVKCRHIMEVKAEDIAVKGTSFHLKDDYLEPTKVAAFYELKEDDNVCVVCLSKLSTIMLNCGHKCMCVECFNDYYYSQKSKTCPMCRVDINSYMEMS
jgi:hypothetical protein